MSVYLEIASAADKVKKLNFLLFGPKNPSEGKWFPEMSFKASVYFLTQNLHTSKFLKLGLLQQPWTFEFGVYKSP